MTAAPDENLRLFGLKYWPFDLVPRSGTPLVWAGREPLRSQIVRLGRRLARHDAVTLHLLWADFGAGKTHTLLFLKQEAEAGAYGSAVPLYSALPKGSSAFIDIYRAIVRSTPTSLIQTSYKRAVSLNGREAVEGAISEVWPSVARCFHAIAIGGPPQQQAGLAWLHGEAGLPRRELQALSITGRVQSTDEAVLALCALVRLLNISGNKRVLLMIDEFQRVEILKRNQQDDINAGLHGFYNACGSGMSVVLSFSFGVEANIRHFLNPELLSRVDPLRITINALTAKEGVDFLTDVIGQAQIPGSPPPMSEQVLVEIVNALESRYRVTPRRLLKAAGLVFELAALDIEDGLLEKLEPEYVRKMVSDGNFDRLDDHEDTD